MIRADGISYSNIKNTKGNKRSFNKMLLFSSLTIIRFTTNIKHGSILNPFKIPSGEPKSLINKKLRFWKDSNFNIEKYTLNKKGIWIKKGRISISL